MLLVHGSEAIWVHEEERERVAGATHTLVRVTKLNQELRSRGQCRDRILDRLGDTTRVLRQDPGEAKQRFETVEALPIARRARTESDTNEGARPRRRRARIEHPPLRAFRITLLAAVEKRNRHETAVWGLARKRLRRPPIAGCGLDEVLGFRERAQLGNGTLAVVNEGGGTIAGSGGQEQAHCLRVDRAPEALYVSIQQLGATEKAFRHRERLD